MRCSKCGNELYDGMAFCDNCGQPVQQQAQQPAYQPAQQYPQQPTYQSAQQYPQQPVYQPAQQYPQQPAYQPAQQPWQPNFQTYEEPVKQMPMKWFKFLIYFSLFAAAVINIINALPMLTGSQYGSSAEAVYDTFEMLRGFDLFFGVFCLALAVLNIYTRFRLAGYRRNGPTMLSLSYVAILIYDVLYIIGANIVLPEFVLEAVDFTGMYSNMAVAVVMLIVNNIYFKKRAHLFVN